MLPPVLSKNWTNYINLTLTHNTHTTFHTSRNILQATGHNLLGIFKYSPKLLCILTCTTTYMLFLMHICQPCETKNREIWWIKNREK